MFRNFQEVTPYKPNAGADLKFFAEQRPLVAQADSHTLDGKNSLAQQRCVPIITRADCGKDEKFDFSHRNAADTVDARLLGRVRLTSACVQKSWRLSLLKNSEPVIGL